MRILVFTDHHGSPEDLRKIAEKAKDVDYIICPGDFTIFENEIEYIMEQMNKLPKKVFLLHGNHEEKETVEFLSKHFKNLEFIHKKVVKIKDVAIIGYGGGGFTIHDPEFEHWIKSTKEHTKGKKVILITHGPPYGTKLDFLSMGYVGNKSYRKYIKKEQPLYALSGHLHETFGKKDRIGKTIVINVGPEGMVIEV